MTQTPTVFAQDPLDRAIFLYERRDFERAFQEANRVIQKIPDKFTEQSWLWAASLWSL